MKRSLLLSVCVLVITTTLFGQEDPPQPFDIGVRWGIQVWKKDEIVGYPGKAAQGTIWYKDKDGLILYTEDHEGVLDGSSYLRFNIGHGILPNPSELTPQMFKQVAVLCWKLTVQTDEGPIESEGMQDVSSVPRANVAGHALNSERLGGALYNETLLGMDEFVFAPADKRFGVSAWVASLPDNDQPQIRPLDTWNFVRTEPSTSVITGEQVNAVRFGKGTGWPFVFGASTPPSLENLYTVCIPPLVRYRHGWGIKCLPHLSPVDHNTAAIFADNTASEMSAGVLANAQTWGVYGTGQNGIVGVTNGPGNGAAATGFVGEAPATGGFKYGLYGNANGITNAWAAALFGNSFHTGTLTMSSDARLKTDVRSQPDVLQKVLALKPSAYKYKQDTPYGFPEGVHYGFLAQEMEQVFPELVSDVPMPLNLDPQEMYRSGSTSYKGINYIEMISILTSAIQELNATMNAKIDAQAKEIEMLKKQ